MVFLRASPTKIASIFFILSQISIILKCEKLPEEVLLDLKIPKCPNGQNALIDAEGLTKCKPGCPDGFDCYKNEDEGSHYCCPDIDLLHKLYDNNNKDFYLNTAKKYPEPRALTSKDVETAFPLFPNGDVWGNLASFPNTKILDIYDNLANGERKKDEKLMKISVLSNRKNVTETITTTNTSKTVEVETKKQHNNTSLSSILTTRKNNTVTVNNNSTSQNITKQNNESKTIETATAKIVSTRIATTKITTTKIATTKITTAKTVPTTTFKPVLPSTTESIISNNQNNIRRKPLPSEQNNEIYNDLNILHNENLLLDEKTNSLQVPEKNKLTEAERLDLPPNSDFPPNVESSLKLDSPPSLESSLKLDSSSNLESSLKLDLPPSLGSSSYHCDRQPITYTCNNGTDFTQLVARWYAKDNQCHIYTWSFCPGDTIAMDKTLRSKEECEEICLKRGHKIKNNSILKGRQSFDKNDNNIIDEINNITNQNYSKNFGSTDIDEIIKMMTIEDRAKLLENQKTFASKIISNDSLGGNFFNSQETETFRIGDLSNKFICVRPDSFVHICSDGFPSQLTLRWFVYENQCMTFPYGYCHGDRVTDEAFAKTKKECESHCLMNIHEKTDII
uniref:BPTI/Kunitz inhibitor domain-containing protein n=1 Tax=Strongyloides venezuelensis TaxID=75913 RepID=A0A0K0EUG5_STRVS